MKKTITILAVMMITATAFSQEKPKPDYNKLAAKAIAETDKALTLINKSIDNELGRLKSDTLTVTEAAKFIKINGRVLPVAAFTQSVPVFLSADAWNAVLQIIDSRDYGKISAMTIGQIIQAIGQQLPQQGNKQ